MGGFTRPMRNCNENGYSHNITVCENKSKWMAALSDNKLLSTISLPGTHDTMSLGFGGDLVQNQSKSLEAQLISGIRFLDIRLAAFPNLPELLFSYHSFIYLHFTFEEILNILTKFLKNNPSETILVRIKPEYTNVDDDTFINLLERILNNKNYSKFLYKNLWQSNPPLRELRGKFMILQNFGGPVKWIVYKYNFNVQDDYYLSTNWDLYSKWEKVKSHLIEANNSIFNGTHQSFINYLSGSGGCFPYFIASGNSSPQTYAPRLSTGLTEPAFHSYYPDFPRVNWFLNTFATIAFEGVNNLTKDYINKNKPKYVGIVVADFPGQGLINSIINVNFKNNFN